MHLNIAILIGFIFMTMGLTYYFNQPQAPNIQSVPIPVTEDYESYSPAPEFKFETLSGEDVALSELKGKTVLLNFWASWCAPCVKEFPQFIELSQKEDVIILAISVDAQKENIFTFLEKLNLDKDALEKQSNFFIAWDPDKKISQDLFQTIRYPETYIIGPDLTLRQKIIGADVDFSSDAFIETLPKE